MSEVQKKNRPGRLPHYDYSGAGGYFITFCTRNRDCCLSSVEAVGRGALAPPEVVLKEPGSILDGYIQNIPKVYPGVKVNKYVIMPNHVHLLIEITGEGDGGARAPRPTARAPSPTARAPSPTARAPSPTARAPSPTERASSPTARSPRPTVQMIVGGIKSLTRRKVGRPIWQTTFYDHIIRDESDYLRIWQYIDTNPAKWAEDEYFVP